MGKCYDEMSLQQSDYPQKWFQFQSWNAVPYTARNNLFSYYMYMMCTHYYTSTRELNGLRYCTSLKQCNWWWRLLLSCHGSRPVLFQGSHSISNHIFCCCTRCKQCHCHGHGYFSFSNCTLFSFSYKGVRISNELNNSFMDGWMCVNMA